VDLEAVAKSIRLIDNDIMGKAFEARRLHLGTFTSIPLFQGRLLKASIPDYGGLNDQIAKLIQVIRSSPSVIAPLIGQKKLDHVEQNLKISDIPPMDEAQYKEAIQILLKGK
jgi:hypothetical protein